MNLRRSISRAVGKANPELLQAAFLQALQDYLNHPDSSVTAEDDFYRTVESYLSPQPADWRDQIVRFRESQRPKDVVHSGPAPGLAPPNSASNQPNTASSPLPPPIYQTENSQPSPEPTATVTANNQGDAVNVGPDTVAPDADGVFNVRAQRERDYRERGAGRQCYR